MERQNANSTNLGALNAASTAPRTWRDYVAAAAYYMGSQRLFERLTRSVEFVSADGHGTHLRRVQGSKYLILCYHRVGTGGVPLYSMQRVQDFEAQMKHLRKHYRILSLPDLLRELADSDAKRQGVAVTFDDGYRDVYMYAWPILRKYSIPATVYLTAGCIESGEVSWYDKVFLAFHCASGDTLELDLDQRRAYRLGTFQQRIVSAAQAISIMRKMEDSVRTNCYQEILRRIPLPASALTDRMLTWDHCREMLAAGIHFGAHTMSHPVVSRLSPEKLQFEVCQSKALIEKRLATEIADFAYPFGQPADCGTKPPRKLRDWGFRSAVTTVQRTTTPLSDSYLLSRVQLADAPSLPLFALRLFQIFSSAHENSSARAGASINASAKPSAVSS